MALCIIRNLKILHFPRNHSRVPLDSPAVLHLICLHKGHILILVVPDAAPKRLRVADDPRHHCICREILCDQYLLYLSTFAEFCLWL